eukprot:scaffold4039_cov154-Amphora_coffeaeformis.AAC.1
MIWKAGGEGDFFFAKCSECGKNYCSFCLSKIYHNASIAAQASSYPGNPPHTQSEGIHPHWGYAVQHIYGRHSSCWLPQRFFGKDKGKDSAPDSLENKI